MRFKWILFLLCSLILPAKDMAAQQGIEQEIDALIDPSVEPRVRKAISEELLAIANIKGSGEASPLHKEIFGGPVEGSIYWEWLKKRIRKIKADVNLDVDARSGVGFEVRFRRGPYKHGPKKKNITVGPWHFAGSLPQRMSQWIHEARHSDGYGHVRAKASGEFDDPMPRPENCFEDGVAQCDDSVYAAFGAEIVFAANMARYCVSCDAKMKHDLDRNGAGLFESMVVPSDRARLIDEFSHQSEAMARYKKFKGVGIEIDQLFR